MESWWFVIVGTLFITAVIRSLLRHRRYNLPPGPFLLHFKLPIQTNPPFEFESLLIKLKAIYGPVFTLPTSFGPSIFVGSHSLAHQILVKNGTVFSDRPNFRTSFNIATASYGPTWRLLRRNLASEVMHPNRIKSYSHYRKWALNILISQLLEQQRRRQQQHEGSGVKVVNHFDHTIFCLLALICFGEIDEDKINEIAKVQRDMISVGGSPGFVMLTMFPRLGKMLFLNTWKEVEKLRDAKERVMIPIIKSRIESCAHSGHETVAYVDTLANLHVPEKGGKLSNRDILSMCSEFLDGGTVTTSTSLQWIMANLVKYPHIQRKLYEEMVAVVGPPPPPSKKGAELETIINEEEVKKMPYLRAVVLEGLRRHPPAHFVLSHRVTKDVEVEGHMYPKGATINFMTGEMGLDPEVWDEPMEFKPDRFLVNDGVFDITGSKGIKMMPFGAGRRKCPGSELAMLHLEYFVANLIWYFDWSVVDGCDVDLSEKTELTIVMKNPLQAQISPRFEKITTHLC